MYESLSHDNDLALALRLMLEVFHLRFLPMEYALQFDMDSDEFFVTFNEYLKEITQ